MPRNTKTAPTQPGSDTGFDLSQVPEQYRAQVEGLIPPEWVAERYINRHIDGVLDFDVFEMARLTRHNVVMPGPTGSGKTTAARAYASFKRLPYVSVEMSGGYDHASVIGTTQAGEDGLPVFKRGELTLGVGFGAVVDIAEVAFAPPRFSASFFGVLDSRQSLFIQEIGERVRKHDACVIFANYNPGYVGTVKMNEAFLNRFALNLPWGYDDAVEEALIGVFSPTLLEVVRKLRDEKTIRSDIGTNVMEEFLLFAQHGLGNIDLAVSLFCNRFSDAERLIVERTLDANKRRIETELGITQGATSPVDAEFDALQGQAVDSRV